VKPLDSRAKRFLLVCGVFFVAAVAFRLNGSSTFIWKEVLTDSASPGGLLLGEPREVRSDEWMVWTPAVIAQFQRGFPAENPALGAGKSPFLYSLPVRHYTMWFRPQLYGFFLFDLDWAYAWYWNVKVFGLLTSMFLLFWTLTRNSAVALFGSLWVFFSNYVQWWFSSPAMLPEMLSSWALALVAALVLLQTIGWRTRVCAATVFVLCSVNFALCLYPPFQIPLLYLGLIVFGTYLFAREKTDPKRRGWQGVLCLAAACIAVAAVLAPFFVECRSTFESLSLTSYPGSRRSHGGELGWMELFSGLMNIFNSESAYPDSFGQPNGAANFLPLWVPVFACTARILFTEPRKHAVAIGVFALLIALNVYALCPLPGWFCNATLLSFCTGVRALLAIGVANVLFVVLTFPILKSQVAIMQKRSLLGLVGISSCLVWFYLWSSVPANPIFLAPWRILMFFAINVGLIVVLLKSPGRAFAPVLIGLLVASNGLVNPVMVGLDPLLKATPATAIQDLVRRDPTSAWAAYESNHLSEFLMAMGANVVSGVKTVPDLDFYKLLDPDGRYRTIYNRYSFAFFLFRRDRDSVGIRSVGFPTHLVSIHPLHPALRARNVRYFLFTQPFADPGPEGIKLLHAFPQNHIWIYDAMPERPL
jgi:hypothetical protein